MVNVELRILFLNQVYKSVVGYPNGVYLGTAEDDFIQRNDD